MNRWMGLGAAGVLALVVSVAAAEWRYVKSQQVNLWAEPSFGAAVIGRLSRGDRVEVLGIEGRWARLRAQDGEGWVPQLVLGTRPPAAAPAASAATPTAVPGARRRASAVVGTGATRGVRGDTGRERLESLEAPDYEALEQWERETVSAEDLDAFARALRQGDAR